MIIEHSRSTEVLNLKKTKPSMAFDPDKESFDEWRGKARAKLCELLGLDKYKKTDDRFNVEYNHEHEKYYKIRFTFQSEEGSTVPCNFIIPKNKNSEKPPLMICLQGHGTGMHISLRIAKFDVDVPKLGGGDRDFAKQCISKGICALTVEQRCFGERGGNPRPDCKGAALTALLTGRTLIGGRVWDIMRAIDVVEEHFADEFDKDKIYCMGNSGGGTATFYASALEDRIAAAMPSCAFCTFLNSIGELDHCACNYVPHIAEYFDMAEIAGMSAPKPLVVVSGVEDGIFPIEGAADEFGRLKKIYSAAGVPDNCVHVKGAEGHRFYAAQGWAAFEKITGK